ncbi:MAG: metallophosphoesterase family protein [Gemmatimonadaceae bacterium]
MRAVLAQAVHRTQHADGRRLRAQRWRPRGHSRLRPAGDGARTLRVAALLRDGGQRFLLVHDLVDASPRSVESHGVVVHGFTHREEMMIRGDTLIVNPGEGCGWLHGEPSGAILDTETKEVHFFKLKDVHSFEASNDA